MSPHIFEGTKKAICLLYLLLTANNFFMATGQLCQPGPCGQAIPQITDDNCKGLYRGSKCDNDKGRCVSKQCPNGSDPFDITCTCQPADNGIIPPNTPCVHFPCCDEECCGKGTAFGTTWKSKLGCIRNPSKAGFIMLIPIARVCKVHDCCGLDCCIPTQSKWDIALKQCVPDEG